MKAHIFSADFTRVRWKEPVHKKHYTIYSKESYVYSLPTDSAYIS